MLAASLLSFSVGFLSLSLEILWIRLFGFANHSQPQAFAFVLVVYLIGIALGARIGKKYCDQQTSHLWMISGLVLMVSSVVDFCSPWIYAEFVFTSSRHWVGGGLIMLTALLKAIVFPIAHHLGAFQSGSQVGRSISRVYVANIAGATIGPIMMGFVLLNFFTTQECFALCASAAFIVGMFCVNGYARFASWAWGMLAVIFFVGTMSLFPSSLLIAKVAHPVKTLQRVVENRHGIITIYQQEKTDLIYGGNVYDGGTNLDPIFNSNHINRLIILAALQPHPERVLMVGLSIGSWLKIMTSFPSIKHIDVVEINPGYLKAMERYPRQQSALADPRVHLYIDDGRRWLRMHPDERYDLIVMNTTFYWRAYSTNLLSTEFLTLLKSHCNQDAVVALNGTDSPDVLKTTRQVFPHVYLYENFVIASDFDWRKRLQAATAERKLAALTLDGKPLFPVGSKAVMQSYLKQKITSPDEVETYYLALGRPLEIITDKNMITEYKYGHTLW